MSEHRVLFSITESNRDGITYQVMGNGTGKVLKNKEDVLAVLDKLREAIVNETHPFSKPLLPGWKKRKTYSMIKCTDCGYVVSEFSSRREGDRVILSENNLDDRTYYEKGKKRLCVSCYNKLFKTEHLGNWIDEGDKV